MSNAIATDHSDRIDPVALYDRATGLPISFGGTGASAQQVQGNVAAAAADSGNPVKVGGKYTAALATLTDGNRGDLLLTPTGDLRVLPTGWAASGADATSNTLAYFGSASSTNSSSSRGLLAVAEHAFNGTSWDRKRKPNATSRLPSAAASTNATSAKASAGDLHCISGYNAAATALYLKFYAKASAPTVGTDVPVITLALPPMSAFNINLNGHYVATGIAYALTTGAADADTGALTAGDILGLTVTYA